MLIFTEYPFICQAGNRQLNLIPSNPHNELLFYHKEQPKS